MIAATITGVMIAMIAGTIGDTIAGTTAGMATAAAET
jgi:hypothetical protein